MRSSCRLRSVVCTASPLQVPSELVSVTESSVNLCLMITCQLIVAGLHI